MRRNAIINNHYLTEIMIDLFDLVLWCSMNFMKISPQQWCSYDICGLWVCTEKAVVFIVDGNHEIGEYKNTLNYIDYPSLKLSCSILCCHIFVMLSLNINYSVIFYYSYNTFKEHF